MKNVRLIRDVPGYETHVTITLKQGSLDIKRAADLANQLDLPFHQITIARVSPKCILTTFSDDWKDLYCATHRFVEILSRHTNGRSLQLSAKVVAERILLCGAPFAAVVKKDEPHTGGRP